MEQGFIKPPVEIRYKEELEALKANDTGMRPENWQMSPRAVRTFILGSPKPIRHEGKEYLIEKKYFGNDALIERCIVTLAGNRGLMLVGSPARPRPCFRSFSPQLSAGSAPTPSRGPREPRRT